MCLLLIEASIVHHQLITHNSFATRPQLVLRKLNLLFLKKISLLRQVSLALREPRGSLRDSDSDAYWDHKVRHHTWQPSGDVSCFIINIII